MRLSHYLIQLAPYPFLELPARRICFALIVGKVYSTFPSSQILHLLRSLTLQKSIGGKLNYLRNFLFESFYPDCCPTFWPTVSSMPKQSGTKTWEKICQKSKLFNNGIAS
ncbi:MAG: hypothetical protein KR126chlam3_01323 [Chlamydiae bacterium]|nr:hypothetical protein [Chlamydiota bacterium]